MKSRSSSSAPHSKTPATAPENGGSGSSRADAFQSALSKVRRFSDDERLFRRAKKVVVAVSGGPDSLACLLLVRALGKEQEFEVVAAHFDHQLRPESASDLARVREICATLGIECVSGEGDVRKAAAQQRMGIEETARRMRYQFLGFVAGKESVNAVVTGHTADDQAETVLMRVVRGTGVRGLRGMVPSAPLPGTPAFRLVRPLLVLSREETEAVCSARGITPIVDPSNVSPDYTRNRIRHETLTALRSINPNVSEALLGVAASARELFAGVERQAMLVQPTLRNEVGAIFTLDSLRPLETEALLLIVEREAAFSRLEAEVNRTRLLNLRSVLTRGDGQVAFGPALVEASCGQVRIGPELEKIPAFESKLLDVPGVTVAGQWRVRVSTEPMPPREGEWSGTVDQSRATGALRARPLAPGDRLLTASGSRRVQDLLVNAHVPRWQRPGIFAFGDSAAVLALANAPESVTRRLEAGAEPLYVAVGRV